MRRIDACEPRAASGGGGLEVIEEVAVLDKLRIESAIVGVIDLLGHQAVEYRTDLDARLIDLNGKFAWGVIGDRQGFTLRDGRSRDRNRASRRCVNVAHAHGRASGDRRDEYAHEDVPHGRANE